MKPHPLRLFCLLLIFLTSFAPTQARDGEDPVVRGWLSAPGDASLRGLPADVTVLEDEEERLFVELRRGAVRALEARGLRFREPPDAPMRSTSRTLASWSTWTRPRPSTFSGYFTART